MWSRLCLLCLLVPTLAAGQTTTFLHLPYGGSSEYNRALDRIDACLGGMAGRSGSPSQCIAATTVTDAAILSTSLADNQVIRGDNPAGLTPFTVQASQCTVDDAGVEECPGFTALCSPGSNTCGFQTDYNASDCLANGSPGTPGTNVANICAIKDPNGLGVLYQLTDTDLTRRPIAMQDLLGIGGDDTPLSGSSAKTALSGPTLLDTARLGRTYHLIAGGTGQVNGGGTLDYFVSMGATGSPVDVLDISGTPVVASASTAYLVDALCTVRSGVSATSTVDCVGTLTFNQGDVTKITTLVSATHSTNVDLTAANTPILKTQAKFSVSSAANNLTETVMFVAQGDPLAITTAGTTSTTSTSTTSTSSTSTTSSTIASSSPPDWTGAAGIVAFWDFESTDGTSSGSCGTNCDLTTVTGTPAAYTTTHPYGAKAVQFTTADGLTRATGNASLQFNDNVTLAGWYRFPGSLPAAFDTTLFATDRVNARGIGLHFQNSPGRWFVQTGDNVTNYTKTLGAIGVTADSWWFVGVTNKSDKTVEITGFNGAATNSTQSQTNAGSVVVNVGDGFGLNTITANSANVIMDEQLLANIPLTAGELCRICSCGLDGAHPPDGGSACTCSGATFATDGARTSMCGSCSLVGVTCNASAPTGR